MAEITYVNTPVSAPVTPGSDDTNAWATHLAKFGKGGFELVEHVADRDAITDERKIDKAVIVLKDPAGIPTMYHWDVDKLTWEVLPLATSLTIDTLLGSGSSTNNVSSIVFKSAQIVKKALYPNTVYVTPVCTYHDEHLYRREASNIRVHAPLTLSDSPDFDNGMNLGLDPALKTDIYNKFNEYEKVHLDGYLSYSRKPIVIKAYTGTDDPEGYLFPNDATKSLTGNTIKPNAATKEILLEGKDPTGTGFLLAFQTYSSSVAQKDGQVTFSFVDTTTPDVALVDVNSTPAAKTIQLKAGESVGTLYLEAIIKEDSPLSIKLKINSTCGDIVLNGYTNGLTGVLIAEITDKDEVSDVIQQWALDTGVNLRVGTYDFSGKFISIPPIATLEKEGFKKGTAFPQGHNVHTIDDFTIWSEDAYAVDIVDDALYVNGSKFFYMGQVIDADRTRLMRDKRYIAGITCNPKDSDYKFVVAFWTGTPNSPTYPILESFNSDGTPHYATGWDHYVIEDVKQEQIGTEFHKTMEFGVSADAQNMAILAFPAKVGGLSEFGLKELFIQNKAGKPEHILYLENDKFDNITFKNMDKVLPTTKTATKYVKAVSEVKIAMDIPVGSFYDVKALRIEPVTGKQSSLSGLSYYYEPKKSELTVSFNETADFIVAVTIYN